LRPEEAVRSRTQARADVSAAVVRTGAVVTLVAAPLAFGAVETTSGVALVAAAWLLLLLWLGSALAAEEITFHTHPVMLPALALLGFTALHWVAGISANPVGTQMEWLRWTGYLALGYVAGESFSSARSLRYLVGALALAGLGIAVLGIAQHLTAEGKIYWLVEPSQGGYVFGPYVNRNHFAGLMELWAPLAFGLALAPGNTFTRRWAWGAAGLVMVLAVVVSGSRGGTLALAVGLAVLGCVVAALRGGRRVLLVALGVITLLAAGTWALGGTGVWERYRRTLQPQVLQEEEASRYRLAAWRDSLHIARQNWLLGTGLDTFETQFPAVRGFPSDKVWTHAHNDFLQLVTEAGVIGLALGIWLVAAAMREILRNLKSTRESTAGALLLGAACGCLGFMVHGWLDFNFHIPANAASFAVLGAVVARRGWEEE
jgi:O-antigen ligase